MAVSTGRLAFRRGKDLRVRDRMAGGFGGGNTERIMRTDRLLCLILTLLVLLAYSNSFQNSFQYDDTHVIERNAFIKDPANIPRFFVNPRFGSGICSETSSYRPLLMASFALNYSLGALNVFGYHLFNFVVHLVCTLLVYFITLNLFRFDGFTEGRGAFRCRLAALFAALLFGLHPVETESVTYVSGRSSSLSALFYLASFLAFAQYRLAGKARFLVFSSLWYVCTLLVKETGVTLFPVLVVFSAVFPPGGDFRRRCFSLAPHLLISILYLALRAYFFGSFQYGSPPARSFYEHVLTQPRAWVHYLGTLLLPLNLNVDYDFPVSHSILESGVVLSLCLLLALILIAGYLSRQNRFIALWGFWFALNLAPTNSLIILEDVVSDRWLYLPSVAFAVLLAYGASWIYRAWFEAGSRAGKFLFFFLCVLAVELYGYSTVLRNFAWTSQRTLWEDAVSKSPNKPRPYNGLGVAFSLNNRFGEAKRNFYRAIALEPRWGQPYLNLGYVYSLEGNFDKAIEFYQKAIPLSETFLAEIYNNLGLVYLSQGKMEEGRESFLKAIDIRPHDPFPYCNLGSYYERKGEIDQAIHFYERSAKLSPESHVLHGALSVLYERKGWKEKSKEAYKKFLRYAPR